MKSALSSQWIPHWAGCSKTKQSASRVLIDVLGVPALFTSKTQSVIALSSTEHELSAICSGVAAGLHICSCKMEARLSNNVTLEIQTDSASAKSIANAVRHFTQDPTHSVVSLLAKYCSKVDFLRSHRFQNMHIHQLPSHSFRNKTC